jgi:inorganic pyrophosphatase
MRSPGIAGLSPFEPRTKLFNVVVETPLGTTVKCKYDDGVGVFRAHKAMPVGFQFPFNFGFVPATRAGDGDPLDVLLLSGHVLAIGTVVLGQAVSVLEAEQVEGKERIRNDRVIAIPWDTVSQSPMLPEISLDQKLKRAITEFFTKYNEAQGKHFKPLRFGPARRATQIVNEAVQAAKRSTIAANGETVEGKAPSCY